MSPFRGWLRPGRALRNHYFVGASSLCNEWNWVGGLAIDAGRGGCKACQRVLERLAAALEAGPCRP